MLNDISLGKYYDTNSLLHRMDPRVKIILYLIYLIVTFMVKSYTTLALLALITLIQTVMARIPVKVMKNTILPVIPIVFFIFLLNTLTIREGNPIWEFKMLMITDEGLGRAVLMSLRILFLIMSTSIMLTLTTTPLKISDALESLGAPLKIIKIPVHEMAMMMSIALRFIPTLTDETNKIMRAQISRGADYDTGSVIQKMKGYVTVLIPLFVSSFKRAEELAVAMDARCYRGGANRTKLNPLKIRLTDVFLGVLFAAAAASLLVVEFVLR